MPCTLFPFPLLELYLCTRYRRPFILKFCLCVSSFVLFCAIGWSNVSKNDCIGSVGPSQPEMMGLTTGLGLWIFVSVYVVV